MSLNGPALFAAARACDEEKMLLEATFLLIAGQVRSTTDLSVLSTIDEADKRAMTELYGMIYFQTGGAGHDGVYRDPVLMRRLFDQIENWRPGFIDGYDPGWKYESNIALQLYEQTARNHKGYRVGQLRHYAELMNRSDYYTASQELRNLQNRNPEGFHVGTDDANRAAELMETMRKISEEVDALAPN